MSIQELASRAQRLSEISVDELASHFSELTIYRSSRPTEIEAMVYQPVACLIVQGQKETTVGDVTVTLTAGQCLVVGHDLPVLSRITQASVRRPYLSLVLRLDLEVLRALDCALEEPHCEKKAPRSLEVSEASNALVDVLRRYLALREDPAEAKVLLPLVREELHFRLLRSDSGRMLRALANRDSHASNIALAIRQLRERYRETPDVNRLARSVGMSGSSFHRHFKSMTMTTPLQYQKDLRLTEARRLLRSGEMSVARVAFEVGYESPSQFSREYSRKFGSPPRADVRAV